MATRASGRAKGEIDRARDVRLQTGQSILAGLFIAWLAVAFKASLNEIVGANTGYIVLMAAAVLAAWVGGLAGGLTAVVVAVVFNHVAFLSAGPVSPVSQFLQGLYVVVGAATVLLIASRRASRDRLADALGEVSALAEKVESRDARLEMMLSASGTGFWEWDVETGELTWSETIYRQHGLEPGPPAPSFDTYIETIHPEDRESFHTAIATALEDAGVFELDYRVVWPDRSIHWTHGAGRLFRDDAGRPLRMIGTGQDITERRRILEDRDRLLADERRAGAFREAFVDVISHELRTPITTIMGLAQILARPGRTDDEVSRTALLEDVRSEAERLHRLVEDLLVLSRVERGRLEVEAEPTEPRRLLERIVMHEGRELPSITVETDLEPDLPIVAGETTYVEQIVRNLLNNAAKYSPLGSRVVVSAHRVDGSVVVRVTDDGPGIPPASVERIFELFYRDPTSSRLVAGSGIGLFVCASLVEAMGGRIWASRPSAGGTEVGFSLRVLEADADEPSLPVPSALPAVLPVRPPPPKRDRDQGSRRARPRPSGSDRQQPDEPDEGTGEDEAPAADPQGEKDQGDDGFGEREDVADRAERQSGGDDGDERHRRHADAVEEGTRAV
jgi:signal transduction histidine kinase